MVDNNYPLIYLHNGTMFIKFIRLVLKRCNVAGCEFCLMLVILRRGFAGIVFIYLLTGCVSQYITVCPAGYIHTNIAEFNLRHSNSSK